MAQSLPKAREVATWIVRTLREHGHVAYFAGGCVRDELLGQPPKDYDVATDARPDAIAALFPRTAHVGAAFGVMLVRHEGETVEVATFRADGEYTDRRRPDRITFSDEVADAARRDFTINALFLDPLRELSDPARVIDHVQGVRDLHARVLRAVGDPDQRLKEDDLRALRAVRLATRLGFEIDRATADAIRRHAGNLRGISRERIGDEVRLMLGHGSRASALRLLAALGLDVPTFERPGTGTFPLLGGLTPPPNAGEVIAGTLACALLDREGPGLVTPGGGGEGLRLAVLRATRRALCLSNEERDHCLNILGLAAVLFHTWSDLTVARQKRAASAERFAWALEILRAGNPGRAAEVEARVGVLAGSHGGLSPTPFVAGDDLVAAGMTPGPPFRKVLERVYDDQLEGKVRTPAEGMALARELYESRRV